MKFPSSAESIPVSGPTGKCCQTLEFGHGIGAQRPLTGINLVNFPVLSAMTGISLTETGSITTASTTTQSDANRRFPVSDE